MSAFPPKPSSQTASGDGVIQNCVDDDTELLIELKTDDGHIIPETAFRLEVQGGETRTGTLDQNGRSILKGLPPGRPFALYYPDKDDVRAKAWAARLDAALSAKDLDAVCGVLVHDPAEVRSIADALFTYYERDLESDCRSIFTDDIEQSAIAHCLHLAGFRGGNLEDVISPQSARLIR